jgi:xylulokinase
MVVGVDVGTTAVKGILLGEDARVLATAEHAHDLSSPHPTWAEESPDDWWRGTVEVLRSLLSGRDPALVQAVGVSGMVPAVVGLDRSGVPVRPSIQQNDARAHEEVRWFAERFDEDRLFADTGATWNQQLVAPKLLWLHRHEGAEWVNVERIVGSYEYVTEKLGAEPYTECNWALESGLWNVRERSWSGPILEAAGGTIAWLRSVKWPHEVVGEVSREAADATGLAAGTPLIAGSADHIAAAFAAGLQHPGDVVMKFGGAGDFLYATDTFESVRELFVDYHDVPGRFVINGCMASSGSLVKWFQSYFAPSKTFAALDDEAALLEPGAEGLVLLPYFLGEKTPLHDPFARGTLIGLTLSHTPAHVYRAVLEGVAYAFRHHLEVLKQASYPVRRIFMMDGGARSALWRGILASVLNHDVTYLRGGESGSALGVAFLAGVTAGQWGFEDIPSFVHQEGVAEPSAHAVARYDELYTVYRDLYVRLKDLYPKLLEAARA